jgi:predicted MFS family arabinose efflux permease
MMQSTAILAHVYSLTQSSYYVGMLGLIRVLPLLFFSLIGGIVADHQDRRRVCLATQCGMGMIALALTISEWKGHTTVAFIYMLVAFQAVARAFDGPARQSMVVNLVPSEDMPNAIGINGISWRLSDVLGPAAMGLVVWWGGWHQFGKFGSCYLLNLVSFVPVLIAIASLPSMSAKGLGDRPANLRELGHSITEGLVFVMRTPVLRQTTFLDFWATFLAGAEALMPAFAKKILMAGDRGYSFLQTSMGVGALVGALMMTWLPTVKKQGRWVIGMVGLYGACTIMFGVSSNLVMAMVFLAGTGFSDMVSTVLRQTIRQMATPDAMRGRMSATSTLFNMSGPQLGDYEAGAMARFTGERLSIAIGGIASLVVAANWTRAKELRRYEHSETIEEQEEIAGSTPSPTALG